MNFCSVAGLRNFCIALSRLQMEGESIQICCYDIALYFAGASRLRRSMPHYVKQAFLLQSHVDYRVV